MTDVEGELRCNLGNPARKGKQNTKHLTRLHEISVPSNVNHDAAHVFSYVLAVLYGIVTRFPCSKYPQILLHSTLRITQDHPRAMLTRDKILMKYA